MKIITWNCNGALRKKIEFLDSFGSDICIIQECEDPSQSNDNNYKKWAENYLWVGDNKNKGLGIFAKSELKIEKLNWEETYRGQKVKYFLPCLVNSKLIILGVWAHKNNSPNFGYIGQFWKYLQINKDKLNDAIIAGDFNSNKIWDQADRWWNHSDVVNELKEIGLESIYHKYLKEDQGRELQPTFYLQKNISKPYHIDYVFMPNNNINDAKINVYNNLHEALNFSDHLPIVVEF